MWVIFVVTSWICSVETPGNKHAWTAHLKTHEVSSLHLGGPGGEIDHSNCGISWSLEATDRLSTDTQLLTQYLHSGRPGSSQIVRSLNWVHKWSTVCVCTRESVWNPHSSTMEPDRPQHDRPAACVIAQQYSSSTFVSFRFHFRKENSAHV